jgi:hypothetical protein
MNRKRKNTNNDINPNQCNTSNKKIRHIDWNMMISASSIRNYMLDDPLLDWLKYYNIKTLQDNPTHNTSFTKGDINYNSSFSKGDSHTEFIMSEGIKFEQQIYNSLKSKYGNRIVQVAESIEARSEEKYKRTIQYMKEGIDIIYQGVIHDYENNLYGCPDLLVRSDSINEIFNTTTDIQHGSPKLNLPYHYIVIDIKHSTLHFSSDKSYLLNGNSVPAYKGQILIYNMILGSILGYKPSIAYILGKKWTFTKNYISYNGNDTMNMGLIDYTNHDFDYIDKVERGIKWIQDMRTNGSKWKLQPPSKSELYPNMKNDKDYPFTKLKKTLSDSIHEITSVWNCGYGKRNCAHKKKIYNWKNKRCTSFNLGFNENKTSTTIDHILNVNRSKIKIRLDDLLQTKMKWRSFGKKVLEFYIDYETLNNNIGQLNENSNGDYIFMIGIGWEENNQWQFKNFILEELTKENELQMMTQFWDFIELKKRERGCLETCFIHWTNAEVAFYNKFLNKHTLSNFPTINFYDMHQLFLTNNIVVNGSLDFKLKNIANAMQRNRLIESHWDSTNPCANGLDAMYMAYKEYTINRCLDKDNEIITNIAKYNEIDCKVMWEILKYLRSC